VANSPKQNDISALGLMKTFKRLICCLILGGQKNFVSLK